MSRIRVWGVVIALFLQSGACFAQGPAPSARASGAELATIASTRQFDFLSSINGEAYRVQIFIPPKASPPEGYPALYVLDGNLLFGTFAEAVRNRSSASEIEPAIVVAISDGDGPSGADRTFDFTTTDLTMREKTLIKELGKSPKFGGGEQFFRVIQNEIKPKVAALAHVDKSRTALFGWSLGGLFVVHAMFSHPAAFATYLAVSPSLWHSDRQVFHEVSGFETRVINDGLKPRLFLGVGSREGEAPVGFLADIMTHKDLLAELDYCQMVQNAQYMARTLQTFFQMKGLPLKSKVFAGDTHNSVPWSAVNPVLDFAFQINLADR